MLERLPVGTALAVRRVSGIACHIRRVASRAKLLNLPIIAYSQENGIACSWGNVVRRNVWVSITCAYRCFAAGKITGGVWVQDRQSAVKKRHVGELTNATTLSFLECQQDSYRRIHARHHIHDWHADPGGVPLASPLTLMIPDIAWIAAS